MFVLVTDEVVEHLSNGFSWLEGLPLRLLRNGKDDIRRQLAQHLNESVGRRNHESVCFDHTPHSIIGACDALSSI